MGAGPGARDLLTLRAVQRLQEADVILYDRLVDTEVLELARRDAQRIFVGKHVGAHSWPQDKINQMIVAEARKGLRVVRLKSGDPRIFGRAGEEISAARKVGITVEIIPGVTAASAAGASLTRSLTERSVANTLVLASGAGCTDDPTPDSTRHSSPRTTTALYMSAAGAERISHKWMQQRIPSNNRVDICIDVSKPSQRHLVATFATVSETLSEHDVNGCAVLLVTWPKQSAIRPILAHNSLKYSA